MSEHSLHRARLVSVVAATLIALACGTNVRMIGAYGALMLMEHYSTYIQHGDRHSPNE